MVVFTQASTFAPKSPESLYPEARHPNLEEEKSGEVDQHNEVSGMCLRTKKALPFLLAAWLPGYLKPYTLCGLGQKGRAGFVLGVPRHGHNS